MTEDEIEQEIRFIKDQDEWPMWPYLPMKNVNRAELPEGQGLGYIFALNPSHLVVKNILTASQEGDGDAPMLKFESIEAMVRAGWIGD